MKVKLKMETYEQSLRNKAIPHLEEMSNSFNLWGRDWEDTFRTAVHGDYGLLVGAYEVTVVKTGELTVRGITSTRAIFSVFDDRIKTIYSALEKLESKKDCKKHPKESSYN